MTKAEEIQGILNELELDGEAEFTADGVYHMVTLLRKGGYKVWTEYTYEECKTLTELRKLIARTGKKVIWM